MLSVLVVEDSHINMRLVQTILSRDGHRVFCAARGAEGIAMAREHTPDLVLMDIGLPDMDGTDAARTLKADPRTRDIVIIAVSAFAMKSDRERALDAGCDGFITKPIERQELLSALRAVENRREAGLLDDRANAPPDQR
jgi:CheY-like chemotaxis protein